MHSVESHYSSRLGDQLGRKWWCSRKLSHDVGEGKVEVIECLFGWVWSQEGIGRVLQPWVVNSEGSSLGARALVACRRRLSITSVMTSTSSDESTNMEGESKTML